jgi:hypothetical protein
MSRSSPTLVSLTVLSLPVQIALGLSRLALILVLVGSERKTLQEKERLRKEMEVRNGDAVRKCSSVPMRIAMR